MRSLVLELLCMFYMSIQITAISNFEEALIICGQEVKTILWVRYKTFSTMSEVIDRYISLMW